MFWKYWYLHRSTRYPFVIPRRNNKVPLHFVRTHFFSFLFTSITHVFFVKTRQELTIINNKKYLQVLKEKKKIRKIFFCNRTFYLLFVSTSLVIFPSFPLSTVEAIISWYILYLDQRLLHKHRYFGSAQIESQFNHP